MATDYTRSVGTAGTMIIRDHGTTVEFIIACSDPWTNIGQYNWSGTVNGVGVGGTVSLGAGFGSRSLGSWSVTSTQTVSFSQAATGTQGLGGAATLSANINRGSAPGKPGKPVQSEVTTTSMRLTWTLPADGGSPLDQILIRANLTSPVDQGNYWNQATLPGNATSHVVTGADPGLMYYWCVYARNANGYGPRSDQLAGPTLPLAPSTPTTSNVTTTGMTVAWTKGDGGNATTGYDIQYSTASNFSGATTVTSTSLSRALTGLTPGDTYYIRVRAKTAAGAGAWSGTKTQITALGTPSTPTLSAIAPTSLTATWPAVAGATNYDLQYSTSSSFSSPTTLSGSSPSRNVTGLTPGVTYYFRVRARTTDVTGSWSGTTSTNTPPSTAPGMSVTAAPSGTSATITLTPPGGAIGVTKYTVERRIGTGTATSADTASSPLVQTGLTPGVTYQWRASAWFGTYQSPWTGWTTLAMPSPSTNPGDYFDGATAARPDLTFSWAGTANNSISNANGVGILGWASDNGSSGGGVRSQRVSGGRNGSFCARMLVIGDATAAGAGIGMLQGGGTHSAQIQAGATYVGSIYVKPGRSQRLAVSMAWSDASGLGISTDIGEAKLVTDTENWTRLVVTGLAPEGAARATVKAYDVEGTGWSPWKSGEWLDADSVMVSLSTLFPWFSGDTKDTAEYDYRWLGTANASVSARYERAVNEVDPLADPDCPPQPTPPSLPTIAADCIDEVGTWRRYALRIPAGEVRQWSSTLPTLILTTGVNAERQVRIRYYPNPDELDPEAVIQEGWDAEQILTYIPPNTEITLDGVTERVTASVDGAAPINANRLLYGTGGVPATWPELRCGVGYVVTLDVPLDAPAGNLGARVIVTQRM